MSIRGVVHYIKTVEQNYNKHCVENDKAMLAQQLFGSRPKLIGIFETMKKRGVNNSKELSALNGDLAKANIYTLINENKVGSNIFKTIIYYYENIARETSKGEISHEYAELTDEILDCLERLQY